MLVDANILLYAVDADSPFHDRAREWLTEALNGAQRVGLPWMSLWAFLRIATNPRASLNPLSPAHAWGHIEEWLDAPPEPLLRFHAGEARIALMDHEAWCEAGFAPADARADAALLERRFAQFEARQRQVAAVLQAHGIGVVFDHCPAGRDPREVLRA